MSDLRSLLHEAAGPTPYPTSTWTADADLARAQRAFRRRRAGRVIVSSGLIAAVTLTVFAVLVPSLVGNKSTSSVPVASSTLVSYTGAQPRGYIIDKVPAGWKVAESDRGTLTLAPVPSDPADSVATTKSEAGEGPDTYSDPDVVAPYGIGIWLEAAVPKRAPLTRVRVGDRPAVIAQMRGGEGADDGARSLFLKQPSGHYLVIQVSDGLHWSIDDIVRLASAIHVTKYATLTVG